MNRMEIRGDIVVLFMRKLTGEVVETIVDVDELDRLLTFKKTWCATIDSNGYYAYCNSVFDGKRRKQGLHRFLMGNPPGKVVDHINGNTLDNRKQNLRIVTQRENTQNRHVAKKNGTSGVRGVHFSKQINRWVANVNVDRKRIYVGCFKELGDAEKAVRDARATHMPYSPEWREKHG